MALWDDFKIGEGDHGCSAVTLYDTKFGHHISHNGNSYWITGCILDLSGIIHKDTEEGIMLGRLIERRYDPYIAEHLDKIALGHTKLETIGDAIEAKKADWIHEGEMKVKRALHDLIHI